MPRKTTAEQVQKNRIRRRIGIFFALICIFAVLGFLFIPGLKGNQEQVLASALLDPYDRSQIQLPDIQTESPDTLYPMFAEKLCIPEGNIAPEDAVSLDAGAAILYNRTKGEVVFSLNALKRMYPASITKTMTCLTVFDHGDLNKEITVTEDMLSDLDPASSVCGIQPGDTLTLEQLLYGLMMPSGNDAANAIAYCVAGGESQFADLMNQEAGKLGATGSHFVNAHGLTDPEHYVTAYDIYLIYNKLLDSEEFLKIIGAQHFQADYTNNGQPVSKTWNRGIWYFTGEAEAPAGVTVIGGKTGTTPEAGYCLSLAASGKGGDQYVAVVLNASSRGGLYESMTTLLNYIQ